MYGRLGELSKAVDDFSAVIRVHPREPDTYKLRAEAQRELGHVEEAVKDFRQATELDPSDIESARALSELMAQVR